MRPFGDIRADNEAGFHVVLSTFSFSVLGTNGPSMRIGTSLTATTSVARVHRSSNAARKTTE